MQKIKLTALKSPFELYELERNIFCFPLSIFVTSYPQISALQIQMPHIFGA